MYKTEQEKFWAGQFGNDYIDRNVESDWISTNISLFSKVLNRTNSVQSVLELGANIGLNLVAIKSLLSQANFSAVEINQKAITRLSELGWVEAYHQSVLDFQPTKKYDFVFVKGILIHLNQSILPDVYELLYKASDKYICIAEYYNPTPVEISYRGHSERLFKRDFAGEMLDKFSDLTLLDYGFAYHRDNNFPQDDITWFLLEKMHRR